MNLLDLLIDSKFLLGIGLGFLISQATTLMLYESNSTNTNFQKVKMAPKIKPSVKDLKQPYQTINEQLKDQNDSSEQEEVKQELVNKDKRKFFNNFPNIKEGFESIRKKIRINPKNEENKDDILDNSSFSSIPQSPPQDIIQQQKHDQKEAQQDSIELIDDQFDVNSEAKKNEQTQQQVTQDQNSQKDGELEQIIDIPESPNLKNNKFSRNINIQLFKINEQKKQKLDEQKVENAEIVE